jgi:hypothetical protein
VGFRNDRWRYPDYLGAAAADGCPFLKRLVDVLEVEHGEAHVEMMQLISRNAPDNHLSQRAPFIKAMHSAYVTHTHSLPARGRPPQINGKI